MEGLPTTREIEMEELARLEEDTTLEEEIITKLSCFVIGYAREFSRYNIRLALRENASFKELCDIKKTVNDDARDYDSAHISLFPKLVLREEAVADLLDAIRAHCHGTSSFALTIAGAVTELGKCNLVAKVHCGDLLRLKSQMESDVCTVCEDQFHESDAESAWRDMDGFDGARYRPHVSLHKLGIDDESWRWRMIDYLEEQLRMVNQYFGLTVYAKGIEVWECVNERQNYWVRQEVIWFKGGGCHSSLSMRKLAFRTRGWRDD